MAQHDYVIDNQSFPATRSDLNSLFQAIASCNSGATAPSTTYANQFWYDTTNNKFYIRNEDNDAWIELFVLDQTGDHLEKIGDTITLDGSGNVGIGETGGLLGKLHVKTADSSGTADSGADELVVENSGDTGITILSGATNTGSIRFGDSADSDNGIIIYTHGASPFMRFFVDAAERMRIDSSGTLLVGKTASDFDGGVFEAGSGGTFVSRSGTPFGVNRNSSDGQLANFYKDGSQVGHIGTASGALIIGSQAGNDCFITFYSDTITPTDGSGSNRDNAIDIGYSAARFDDIFATNGTIQTSDQNEKQQIASLTDAEITAAKALSKLFKTFKWNSAVESKGDNARKHTGHVAQEVEQAMTDAGLNAADYAFFCSDTWWETQTEVPAVEAREAVYDDDGNLVTEAIEAIDAVKAHTRRDVYYTADEAPEGATQHTRLGIRYPELLAFIGAATEQRLTSIEARLTALEG